MNRSLIPGLCSLILFSAPALYGRPEFLARYSADPFARPEMSTCDLCHSSPAGGGPVNAFGRAMAKAKFQITPALRAKFSDRFLPSKSSQAVESQGRPVKAVWASARENETLVQVGEDYFLLNRAEGTLAKISSEQAGVFAAPAAPAAPQPAVVAKTEEPLESRTLPTFDYYLVNLPTNRPRPARYLQLRFSHRFQETLTGHTGSLRDLFGLDSTSISSLGVEMGLVKRLSFVTYRMPRDQTIEMGPQVQLLEQGGRVPLSLSFRATVEGQLNFTERFTANFQPIVSRSFGDRAEIFVVPTFSVAVPRRTLTFDFPVTPGERRDNLAAIGLGTSIRIRPKVALVLEWTPRVGGFRGFRTSNTYSFAVQRRTNRHVFGLTFSNNTSSTTSRAITDGREHLSIGFNLYRRLW